MNESIKPRPRTPSSDNEALVALGPQLLIRLSALIRTARTHDVSNQAFQRQLEDCLAIIRNGLKEESELALAAVAEYFYLNGVRIRATASLMSVYHTLMAEFERRSLGGIRFLDGVNAGELERFFQLFMAADDPVLAEQLPQVVSEASIENVIPVPASMIDDEDLVRQLDDQERGTERGRAKRVFWRAVLGTKKIVVRAAKTGRPDLRHAKRLVQPVVDNIMNHEYSIVGLTALKDHDEYTYAHCVNVSVLSISMGNALGIARQGLADLGVAGLLHDIGKISVPGDVLRKPGKLDEEEWVYLERHPLEGVKMMFRMPGLSMLTLDSMRVCFEHHMNLDKSGYPKIAHAWGQGTLSRIVALADCFDAMTAHRAYQSRPFSPFEGLQFLMAQSGTRFDPAVMWALTKTVGLYPPGSVLQTASGTVVLSISPNLDDLRRPNCKVLVHPNGQTEPEEGGVEWTPMPQSERVIRVLKPEEHPVETVEYLAA